MKNNIEKLVIDRITKNEKRLDSTLDSIKKLEEVLEVFKKSKNNIRLLNNYYGSKNWFKDKELFENGSIPRVKAGVLSEDTVWNMNDDIKELLNNMKKIIDDYNK